MRGNGGCPVKEASRSSIHPPGRSAMQQPEIPRRAAASDGPIPTRPAVTRRIDCAPAPHPLAEAEAPPPGTRRDGSGCATREGA